MANISTSYKPQSEDTSIAADRVLFQILSRFSPVQKTERVKSFHQSVKRIALLSLRRRLPDADNETLIREYVRGKFRNLEIPILIPNNLENAMLLDPISLAQTIADILQRLEIPYMVGGSVASSLWGEERLTQDLDLVIDLDAVKVSAFVAALSGEFYIDEMMVEDAIARHSSFNAIHLFSAEKVDFFVLPPDAFSRSKFSRRQPFQIADDPEITIDVYSPEDIVLQKLRWYVLTGRQCQKQWRDVLGMLKLQGSALDLDYLKQWAEVLELMPLLTQSLQESGLES